MSSPEGRIRIPEGETYDITGPKKILEKISANPKLAEKFTEAARGRAEDIFESGHLKEKIRPGDKVLYIGTGTGHVAEYIEKQTEATVFKLDLADLRSADTKDNDFVLANARRLPIRDGSVDVVCLFDILHHTKGQEEILKEAFRVLKPGAKCLIMEDTIPEPYERGVAAKKMLVGKMDDVFNQQPRNVNPHGYHSISDWEVMLHDSGFEVSADKTRSWHWGLPDFAGADRAKRPGKNTLLRPFEATMFDVEKPNGEKGE
jgi:SAM-dependent methyltransferase